MVLSRSVIDDQGGKQRGEQRCTFTMLLLLSLLLIWTNLGREIELLKPLGIKIAVIINALLASGVDVRDDLMQSDWFSLKVDFTREDLWRRINRPQGTLRLRTISDGMLNFLSSYHRDLESIRKSEIEDVVFCPF